MSLLSVAKAASMAYFSRRVKDFSDPSPPLVSNVLPVFFIYLFVALPYVATWAFIAAYMKELFLVVLALVVLLTASMLSLFKVRVQSGLTKLTLT